MPRSQINAQIVKNNSETTANYFHLHSSQYTALLIVYGQNGDKPKRQHLFREYVLKKDVKRDKLLVVLIVVTLLCLIVRFSSAFL